MIIFKYVVYKFSRVSPTLGELSIVYWVARALSIYFITVLYEAHALRVRALLSRPLLHHHPHIWQTTENFTTNTVLMNPQTSLRSGTSSIIKNLCYVTFRRFPSVCVILTPNSSAFHQLPRSPYQHTYNGIAARALLERDRAGIRSFGIWVRIIGRYTCIHSRERKIQPGLNLHLERKGDYGGREKR